MAVAKLPVLETVGRAYAAIRTRQQALADVTRNWAIAAGVALAVGLALVLAAPEDSEIRSLSAGQRASEATSLAVLVLLIGLYVIIVKWHRVVIRRVSPAETRRGSLWGALLYFARGLLFGSLGLMIFVVGGLMPISLARHSIPAGWHWYFAVASLSLATLAAFAFLARTSLVLPGGAIGDLSLTLRKSWALTRGNTLRMIAGSALSSGPAVVLNWVTTAASRMDSTSGSVAAMTALYLVSFVLLIVAAIVQAGFLSYAYVFFTGYKGDAAEALG